MYRLCFTTPSDVLSCIMADAYKKYMLTSLLVYGNIGAVPKFTSYTLQSFIKTKVTAYEELYAAYQTLGSEQLRAAIRNNEEKYKMDGNFGLVKQVLASMLQRNIARHTKVYVTVPIADIQASVK